MKRAMRGLAAAAAIPARRCAWVLATVGMLWPVPALAQQVPKTSPVQNQGEQPVPHDDGQRTVARLPANLFRGAIGIFSVHNLRAATVGSLATGAAFALDDGVMKPVFDPSTAWAALEKGGRPVVSATVLGAVFVTGRLTGGPRFRAASYDWLDAWLINAGYTHLLQAVTGRERPNHADSRSFPSGHTSNAFALATVAERHYGWKVGIAAYGLAATMGFSRIRRNEHYLSDVVAGATLGHIVGRTVVRVNDRAEAAPKRTQVTVSPAIGPYTRALVVRVSF